MAAERAKLCDLQDKVHVVEMRLGIRIPPSPRLQWRRAALLVRSALQQKVGHRRIPTSANPGPKARCSLNRIHDPGIQARRSPNPALTLPQPCPQVNV